MSKVYFKLLPVLLIFFLTFNAFSLGGALSGSSSPLRVIRTEYFDIIFPEECRTSAKKIESVCDDYYIEISSILETEPYQRFPVTITRSVEVLNAYYSAVPYNRIVLYDTLPEKSLDMYEETIQSVFYHELTHAVTYNMKSERLKKLSFISDALTPAWASITTFWAEGATVSFESKGRGGRLNDPFSTQMVNQSLIEGKFPGWRDVTGARDTYPGGTDAYMFGSMFASYLQETYGMSKYADFWKKAGSSLSFSFVAGVFKKTYGMKVGEAWDDFKKTLVLPHGEKSGELISHKKSRTASFDVFFDAERRETKIAYFDTASSSLRLATLDSAGKIKKNKKLLAITGITRVSFSHDGKIIALSRYIDKRTYKCVVGEYYIEKKKYIERPEEGVRDAYIRLRDGTLRASKVQMYDAEKDGSMYVFAESEIPFTPVGIENNLFATIVKDGLKWKIRLFDGEKTLRDYDFSEIAGVDGAKNLILHNLHVVSSDSEAIWLSFSWAELGKGGKMLSRAGIVKIARKDWQMTAFLQKENGFAGIVDAVFSREAVKCLEKSKSQITQIGTDEKFSVFVAAAQYEETPLYRIEMTASDFVAVAVSSSEEKTDRTDKTDNTNEKNPSNPLHPSNQRQNSESAPSENPASVHTEISYNPFRYYKNGVFVPLLAQVPVYNHDFGADSSAFLGLIFVSTNPWGDRGISFSAGYDPFYNDGGFQLGFSGGDDSFQYALSGTCIFDKKGFMQTFDSLQLTQVLWRGKVSAFSAGAQGNFLYGRQIVDDDLEKGRDDSVGKSADALAFLQFSNVHKVSPRVFNSAGFAFKPFVLCSYRDSENRLSDDKYINAGAVAQVRFPIFVPFIFTASLFPSSKYAASGSVQAILADFEIHKGIPAVSLFVQRVVLSASYSGKISYIHDELWDIKRTDEIFKNVEKSDYSDAISLNADLYLSPNTGFFANDEIQFSIGAAFVYRPNPKKNENRVGCGITFGMNY